MGKTKKSKRFIADKVRSSRNNKERTINPFDLRVNKQKQNILGRNHKTKGQIGNPGQARTKANKLVSFSSSVFELIT